MTTTERLLTGDVSTMEGVVRVLEDAGIDMIFGIVGGNMGALYDVLYDHKDTIRTVLVRHEQLASVMAEVYGRLTGKPGIAVGQGAFVLANALLGTLEAQMGSSPMLLLTDFSDQAPLSQHAPYQGGTGEYGNFDMQGALAAVTKYTTSVHAPAQAVHAVQLAIKHALTGERGPVGVIFHSASLRGSVGAQSRPAIYPMRHYLPQRTGADAGTVSDAAKVLGAAQRPVVVAGNGVRIAQAYGALERLATTLAAPVATTASGKGVFPETHELALGVMGNFGQAAANAWIGEADVVLAVGTKLGPTDTAMEHAKLIDPARQTLIQIDVEARNVGWSFPVAHALIGDAGVVLDELAAAIRTSGDAGLDARRQLVAATKREHGCFVDPAYTSDEVPVMPQRLFAELSRQTADDAFITCDAGENRLFMTHYFRTKAAGTLIMPGIGAMGYAIPAALAAKLVYPQRQVVAVTGDGGFGMALNGLMTARDENIPIVVVVLNNSALGWVMHGQGNRTIASQFTDMNFADVARALGCKGIRVESPAAVGAALTEALASGQPTVVDVVTSLKPTFRDVTTPLLMRR